MELRSSLLHTRICLIFLVFLHTAFAIPDANIAAALITAAPVYNGDFLEKRAADQTCGYISGDPSSPLVCRGTSTCNFDSYYWGCCDQLGCDRPETCQLDSSPYCAGVASANCIYSQIRRCSDACVTYVRETAATGSDYITSWTCGPTSEQILVLATTTTRGDSVSPSVSSAAASTTDSVSSSTSTGTEDDAGSVSKTTSSSAEGESGTGSIISTASSTGTGTSTHSTTSISSSSSSETASPSATSTHHGLSGGKIAGITVGSVVGAVIICAAVSYLVYKYCFSRRPSGNDDEFEDDQDWNRLAVELRSQASTN